MKIARFGTLFNFILIFSLWISSCTPREVKPVSLSIAAAGVFRSALFELEQLYTQEKPNIVVSDTAAGGFVMAKRIEQGEPFDLFVVGSQPPMDELQSQGFVLSETRKNFVTTEMVLIVPQDSTIPLSDFQDLTSDRVKTVAMPTERLDSGVYTKEILTNLGTFEQLKRKAMWADVDIREVLKMIERKQADAGITFFNEAKLSDKVKIVALAPPDSYKPIVTTLAVLKNSSHIPEAKALLEFMTSKKAMSVMEKYGFKPIK